MRSRRAFSLIEVIVALLLLSTLVLGSQAYAVRMLHVTGESNLRMQAIQLAQDRIDLIRLDPQFDSLGIRYPATETSIQGHPTFTRTTIVEHTQTTNSTGTLDFFTVTVQVTAPGLTGPVERTLTIATP
jgi:prepilin-type N-terminal cleavage/methylation domain-containing protein